MKWMLRSPANNRKYFVLTAAAALVFAACRENAPANKPNPSHAAEKTAPAAPCEGVAS